MSDQHDIKTCVLDYDLSSVGALLRICEGADGMEHAFFLDAPRTGIGANTSIGVYAGAD